MEKPRSVFQEDFAELYTWVQSMSRFGKVEDFFITDYKEKRLHLTFFTKDHRYHISARKHEGDGYLGCTVQTRKPRAGEDWNRGNDLVDGSYSETTWRAILADIIAYELVKVVKQ